MWSEAPNNWPELTDVVSKLIDKVTSWEISTHDVKDFIQYNMPQEFENNCKYWAKILPEIEWSETIFSKSWDKIKVSMDWAVCTNQDWTINEETVLKVPWFTNKVVITDKSWEKSKWWTEMDKDEKKWFIEQLSK